MTPIVKRALPVTECDPGPQGLYPGGSNKSNSVRDAVRYLDIRVESPSKEEAMRKTPASRKEEASKRSKPPEVQSEEAGKKEQSILRPSHERSCHVPGGVWLTQVRLCFQV
ncbi:hypothetical protein NDU88_004640 [Pleurodeles waltl]|uniref:Uncharacterized protein n=1 Tax=Pleurodeles waltl TaxID=8319 RepID=A0AAV7RHF6_PLEWA|nr:hypothetical protein NDU88_004640 [Pleurodeles waltl]